MVDSNEFSIELRFIIMCCRVDRDYADLGRQFQKISDYGSLISIASYHGVLPVLYKTIKDIFEKNTFPIDQDVFDFMEKLKHIYRSICQKNMLMSAELIHIVNIFEKNGIEAFSFKGPVLASIAYGDITLRQFSDLDILVEEKELFKVGILLSENNYTPIFPIKILKNRTCRIVTNDLGFTNRNNGILLELHWKLFREKIGKHLSFSTISENKQYVQINSRSIPTFSMEMLLVYLCLHGSKHAWERWEWICDIDRLIRHYGALDWNKVDQIAMEMQTIIPFYLGISLANRLLDTPLPETMSSEVERKKIDLLIDKTLILLGGGLPKQRSYKRYAIIHRYQMGLIETKRQKIRHIFSTYFGISQNDCLEFPLPNLLKFLYLFIKPVRVVRKYIRYGG